MPDDLVIIGFLFVLCQVMYSLIPPRMVTVLTEFFFLQFESLEKQK